MSIDKKDIDRVIGMSKKDFDEKLSQAVNAAGVDKRLSETLLRDSDKIKKALGSLSDKDISDLSEILKKNNLGKVEELIKNSFGE